MLIRLRHGRRAQFYVKLAACLLVAVFYFTILFRESLNAFEQNKEKEKEKSSVAVLSGIAGDGAKSYATPEKLKVGPKLLKAKRKPPPAAKPQPQPTLGPLHAATVPSTLNPVYEYSEEIHSATEKSLEQRRAHLNAVCARHNLQSYYPPNPWEFFISPGHNLVWCNVFKAASSTWMYYFNILGGYDIAYLQRTETQPLELARKRFPRPEIAELRDSLPSALSFLFARDPFERIVSAYRNKLEGGRNSFYKTLGHKIVHQYRRHGGGRSHYAGPSFEEFLSYVIAQHERGKRFDEHWAPVYSFCTPCSVNFTIIGKVETFQRDSEFIIRQAGLESLLLGKLPRHKMRKIGNLAKGIKTDALVARYFAEIDRETLDQLLNIYRLDFELFDYDYAKYYEIVQPGGGGDTTASIAAASRAENATGVLAAASAATTVSTSSQNLTNISNSQKASRPNNKRPSGLSTHPTN